LTICDRYLDSSLAYQGYGQGLEISWLKSVNKDLPIPSLTFLLDLPAKISLTRQNKKQKFENLGINFLERVRQGYLKIAQQEPKRIIVLNALNSPDQLINLITQEIKRKYLMK
jgi:dTMP kinase